MIKQPAACMSGPLGHRIEAHSGVEALFGVKARWALKVLLGVFATTCCCSRLNADRVWIQPRTGSRASATQEAGRWYPPAIETQEGEIVRFDAERLELSSSTTSDSRSYSATRVIWVEPEDRSELESELIRLFAEGRYAKSVSKLPGVLREKPPFWRQQWLTMVTASGARNAGRSSISLDLVSTLDQQPLPPLVLAWLPVAWTNGRVPAEQMDAAKSRLADPSALVRLVAASWLLSSPDRSAAVRTLAELSRSDRPVLAALANVLRWRTATPPEITRSADEWEARLNRLPMVLQSGPASTLQSRFRAAGLIDRADRLKWSNELTPIHPHPHP